MELIMTKLGVGDSLSLSAIYKYPLSRAFFLPRVYLYLLNDLELYGTLYVLEEENNYRKVEDKANTQFTLHRLIDRSYDIDLDIDIGTFLLRNKKVILFKVFLSLYGIDLGYIRQYLEEACKYDLLDILVLLSRYSKRIPDILIAAGYNSDKCTHYLLDTFSDLYTEQDILEVLRCAAIHNNLHLVKRLTKSGYKSDIAIAESVVFNSYDVAAYFGQI